MTVEMEPLPRGRHGIPREDVVDSQRTRLLRALAETMAEKGYARTSVADVLRAARVSRETFYELFSSKEDCFMAAFEDIYARVLAAVAAPAEGGASAPIDRLSRVLDEYLSALTADPVAARVFMIEVYAAGPSALGRRLELQRRLIDAIADAFGASGAKQRFAVEAYIGAIVSLVTARLAVGDVDGLRQLHRPLISLARQLGLDAVP